MLTKKQTLNILELLSVIFQFLKVQGVSVAIRPL